jgi:hypothetical protein
MRLKFYDYAFYSNSPRFSMILIQMTSNAPVMIDVRKSQFQDAQDGRPDAFHRLTQTPGEPIDAAP